MKKAFILFALVCRWSVRNRPGVKALILFTLLSPVYALAGSSTPARGLEAAIAFFSIVGALFVIVNLPWAINKLIKKIR